MATLSRSTRSRSHSESVVTGSSVGPSVPSKSNGTYSATPPSSYRGMRYLERDRIPETKTSTFKSPELEITIYSSSVRVVRREAEADISLPIFGDNDHVAGSVALDPQNCAAESGRLTITIEGAFEYISPMSATKAGPSQITPGKHRHVFYQDSAVIPLYTSSEPPTRPTFRSAIATFGRRARTGERTLKKAKSMEAGFATPSKPSFRSSSLTPVSSDSSSSSSNPKTFNFEFELPKGGHDRDELPPTFSSSNVVSAGVRGRVYAENADVRYRVRAVWEALDGSNVQAQLEAPILFQPDIDFQSLDGLELPPQSWSETPLSKVEGVPIECAITMPDPATFSRKSLIPYFVVFTTTPRSRSLAAEIMADATIAVSLVRRVGFDKPNPGLAVSGPASTTGGSKGKARESNGTGLNIGATLRTVSSSADLRSLRRKASLNKGPVPPMPRLDTSASVTSSSSSSSQPSSPSSTSSTSATSCSHSHSPPEVTREKPRERTYSHGNRLLKRVVRSAPPILSSFRLSKAGSSESEGFSQDVVWLKPSGPVVVAPDKPLPTIPQEADFSENRNRTTVTIAPGATTIHLTDSRTLHTDVSVGFPKRPKGRAKAPGSHPSLDTASALPDGLYKGSIPLQRGWFPSVKWKALSIEYFLQVSVIFDNTEFKGQVPLRVH